MAAGFEVPPEEVTEERIAAIGGMSQTVSEERKALNRDIERVGLELVDHAMWRLAELAAAVLAFLVAAAVAVLLIIRKLFFTLPRT